jgi:hypothetical protein
VPDTASDRPVLLCPSCERAPAQIPDIVAIAAQEGMIPDNYVWAEEGTLNRDNGHFLCDGCFIAEEMRIGHRLVGENGRSWVCP